MTSTPSMQGLEDAIRSLLLPVSEKYMSAAAEALAQVFNRKKVPVSDRIAALKREWRAWTVEGEQSPLLSQIVLAILKSEATLPTRFSDKYFKTYDKLRYERYLPPAEARALLGNTLLILDLLRTKKMSCTQIARVLSVTQSDHEFNWAMIQPIARALGEVPKLDPVVCDTVYARDVELEEARFADASPQQAIDIVADIGDELGYDGSLFTDLSAFYADYKPGYGIMLHMGCLVLEFYDHPPKEAPYEFQPRGEIGKNLATRFHKGYAASESPYLNNAKGAANLDAAWAWARQPGYIGSALAFSTLLDRLGSMPYSARKQLAPWIRQWLHRISREKEATFTPIGEVTDDQIRRLLEGVTDGNTRTRGVLEQRIVDLLSATIHPDWDQRGVGDFVNASNVRKRKTGDVEFLNIQDGVINAYEAHGGTLTEVYVDLHRQTLRQVLLCRREELSLGRTPEAWNITIRFIAHDVGAIRNRTEVLDGFRISWEFQTYKEFLRQTEDEVGFEKLSVNFTSLIVAPINVTCVPEEVRKMFWQLAG